MHIIENTLIGVDENRAETTNINEKSIARLLISVFIQDSRIRSRYHNAVHTRNNTHTPLLITDK